jgi:hypothetical protein
MTCSSVFARFGDVSTADPAALDALFPHPIYAAHGWISVLNPDTTDGEIRTLVQLAHTRATTKVP